VDRSAFSSGVAVSAKVVVYLGPARSGKTHEVLRQYRDALRQTAGQIRHRAIWLAPNARAAAAIHTQILADGVTACLSPGITTFDQLSTNILAGSPTRLVRLTPSLQRDLIWQVVERARQSGALKLFNSPAAGSGFIDLLTEHIQELKRHGISPAAYLDANPPRTSGQQHGELAHLYADYERLLSEYRLYDRESADLLARDTLAGDECRQLEGLELVVVDGFTDFTHTQHEILSLLAQRATRLLISLPEDSSQFAARADLFAKVTATLAQLRSYHPKLEEQHLPARPSDWPALDHIASHVFRRPSQLPAPSAEAINTLDQIEIVEAAGAHDEIIEIARRIKQRLTEIPLHRSAHPTRPQDIVVVFRSLNDAAPRIREVFTQFGIPYFLDTNPRLISAPVVKTLLALLRLDLDDWPFRRVVAALTNNALTRFEPTARQAAVGVVRDLQIARGRARLLERVDQLAVDHSARHDRADDRTTKAQQAKPAFAVLAESIDGLPTEVTPTQWSDALIKLGAALGLTPFIDSEHASLEPTDVLAWQAVTRYFSTLELLNAQLGQSPRAWSRDELTSALLDFATHQSLPSTSDDIGRVRILAAPAARTVTAKHLFLAGMSEQAFPSPERAGRLATDSDYQFARRTADRASGRATPTPPVPTRAQEEMLLFYEVVSRAEESLTISYPALDDKAQTLPPSPYVREIGRVFAAKTQPNEIGHSAQDKSSESRLRRAIPRLSPVPQLSPPLRAADWRIQAVAKALDGDRHALAGLLTNPATQAVGNAIAAGLQIVHARAHGDYGSAEGLLTSPAVAARLAQRFSAKHLWSPSQWETYAACPYKFYLENVLNLTPLGDLVLETDFAHRGSRLHHVLAAFHRQWPTLRGQQPRGADEEAAYFLAQLQEVIDERIAAAPRVGIDAALLELDRRQIRKWAADHFKHHQDYDGACAKLGGQMTPRHFEFRFGPAHSGNMGDDPDSIDTAFVININGESVRIAGQIDRIDVGTIDGRTVFNVIDYKSGRKVVLRPEHIASGERLQLPIYVEAAQALIFGGDATPLAAGYWSMTGGFDAKGALAVEQGAANSEQWREVQETVRHRIRQFIDSIRHGEFPVFSRDDQCTSLCEFNTVCRVAQIRSLNKTWTPTENHQPPAPSPQR